MQSVLGGLCIVKYYKTANATTLSPADAVEWQHKSSFFKCTNLKTSEICPRALLNIP